jgi:hypothetical protein
MISSAILEIFLAMIFSEVSLVVEVVSVEEEEASSARRLLLHS